MFGRSSLKTLQQIILKSKARPSCQTVLDRSSGPWRMNHWPWARAVLGVLHRVDGGGVVGRNQERKTAELLPHSQSFDESREMRGDRTCEGVVLVLQASSNCPQRNPSRMLVAFRGMRSVTVLMNAAVDQTGCAFRSDMGRFPHSPSASRGTAPQVPRRLPCHGLPPGAMHAAVLEFNGQAKASL
jgi:hypothetical protein